MNILRSKIRRLAITGVAASLLLLGATGPVAAGQFCAHAGASVLGVSTGTLGGCAGPSLPGGITRTTTIDEPGIYSVTVSVSVPLP